MKDEQKSKVAISPQPVSREQKVPKLSQATSETTSTNQMASRINNPGKNMDLMMRINGMYRLLNLYKEQGSGGLVDKILIAQESLAELINRITPGSYASLTKIDFASLDKVSIQPLGVYGDKAAIVDFLRSVTDLDDETAILLLAPTNASSLTRLNQPVLASGLYLLLPKDDSPSINAELRHRAFIIYWPEDATWNDTAIGAVRRNRTTFMRYLTKLTPQILSLISNDHANTIVWKGVDCDQDEYDNDDFEEDGSEDDEANHDRFFKFEVSRTTEQEEGAQAYPGFELAHLAITAKAFPSEMDLPAQFSTSLLETKLIAGECSQGFLASRFVPYQKELKYLNMEYNRFSLGAELKKHKNVILGNRLTEEGVRILLEEGGLENRVATLIAQWKLEIRTAEANHDKDVRDALSEINADFKMKNDVLAGGVKIRVAQEMLSIYPLLDLDRLLGRSPDDPHGSGQLDYLEDLYTRYPPMKAAELEILRDARLSTINSQHYKRAKERLLSKRDVVMACDNLSDQEREDLLFGILHEGKKEGGLMAKLSDGVQWLKQDRTPEVPQNMSDQDFLLFLDDLATQRPILNSFVENVRNYIYDWAARKLEDMASKLRMKIEFIHRREANVLIKERAKVKSEKDNHDRFGVFKAALQKALNTNPEGVSLTINEVRRGRTNYGQTLFKIKGELELESDPYIEYTLFPLNLTESDKANIQDDPLFIPRPQAFGAISFKLSIQDTIRYIQAIGNKILLIVDRPSGISIWLNDRLRVVHDRPVKHFPSSKRQYLFCVHEQKRLLAIAYTDPTGQILVQIQSFDETFSSLQARGSPQNITAWYQDGPPDLRHICFAGGPEELCLLEGSGRVRIFSFVSQGFRAATLQLPSELQVHSVFSAPDDSSVIIVEKTPSSHQIRVYHWNSFGQLPQGCVLSIPVGMDFSTATAFSISSIGQRSNIAVLALSPSQNAMRCINIQIQSKNTAYSFRSKDGKNTKVLENTVHNSFMDCFADVWARYPVVSAIKRETISCQLHEVAPRLTFVCNHESRLFSTYFRRMIKEFERVTRKPVERALDAIEIDAASIEDLDWRSLEARLFRAGEWFVELLCLIPIHIAVAQHNSFVPLKDGVLDPVQEQRLLGATVDQITDSISLGWYESIFNSYMATKPVKVVSSMGEQSVGKSFTLNHIVDSSFAGSALRTTEGVWLSVCPTRDTLVVALDFEGVHSIERSPQEDMLLVLFNTALSNMVLFRNNFALSRDVANMFTSFQASTALLDPAANPKLFKSLLTVIIKDVVEGDKKEIVKEFSSKFCQIVSDEQETNFISVLHASQLTVIPWPVIQSRPFYTLFSRLRNLLFKQPTTHASAGEFLLTLKTLMAKLKAQDWGAIDQNLTKHRVALLVAVLPCAMANGFAELQPEKEDLKNLDNQAPIPWEKDSGSVQLSLSKSTTDRAGPLSTLVVNWKHDAARYDMEELSKYLNDLVLARVSHAHRWIEANTSRFPKDSADIRSLKSATTENEELLKAGVQICRLDCSTCRLPCLLPKAHADSWDHSCQTSHKCLESCEYVDEHTECDETACGLPAGHTGRHLCDPAAHSCGERCQLAGHRGCQINCMKAPEHPQGEGHLCSARSHQCGRPCDLQGVTITSPNGSEAQFSCPNFCTASYDEEHQKHICGERLTCPIKCELCSRLCTVGDHLHGLLAGETHSCRQEHACSHECESQGICEINTEPRSVESTFTGAHETFQFTKYTQIANRLRCAVPIPPGGLEHAGPHIHSTSANLFHYCEATCENCGYICHLPLNHTQREHETKHGSMQNTSWAVEGNADTVAEVQGRKYAARDTGTPHICSSVCTSLGRHAHIDYCRSQNGSCQGAESVHINERMLPSPDRPKDWISHKLFWARTGFKDPYSSVEQAEFTKCDVQCPGKEHQGTATAPARPSECILPIFHAPQPLNWTGVGNGYVSADGHAFSCVNPNNMRQAFHVIFVLDRSGSMWEADRMPLPNTPSTRLIARWNNNRFGAVLSALHGFWLSRSTTGSARRDSYSVIVFNAGAEVIVSNDFTSSPDQLLNKVVDTDTDGGTNFDVALRTAETTMDTYWTNDRAPVIIFLSDGECSLTETVMFDLCNKAVARGKALSFHAVSFGELVWSVSLRRMVAIAEEVAKNAPRDPLAHQLVPCGYTDAMDTIKLAETFLNIADSLKRPKASLIRT